MSCFVPTKLSIDNHHPMDDRISFEEASHIYTIDGDTTFTSVTTFVHQHFPHFDADATITSLLSEKKLYNGRIIDNNSKYRAIAIQNIQQKLIEDASLERSIQLLNDTTSIYYQEAKSNIAKEWSNTSTLGTKTHFDIECFYNDIPQENDTQEYAHFMTFHADFRREFPMYRPYRTEWTVFYKELKLAGSIDMIFENIEDGTLMIYDWKRVKSIEYEAFGNRTATDPTLHDIPDSNFWHYSLQLNTYKAILEAQYDKIVTKLVLVRLYPDAPTYELHECHDLQDNVKTLFEKRRNILNKNT